MKIQDDNELPIVTIITSTYNQSNYLEKCIESVLNQDYPNIEYLVFNDGSTDNTEEILKKYNKRIYWETQPNLKESPTLNKAFKIAKGEIIGKLSSDDYYYPGLISEIVSSFLKHPEIIVAYPSYDIVDENDKLIGTYCYPYNYEKSIRDHICMPGVGTFFKKDLLDKIKGLDESFERVSDLLFWWRAGLEGDFLHIPKSYGAFRVHSGSQTIKGGLISAKETIRLIQEFYSYNEIPEHIKKIKKIAFSNAYFIASTYSIVEKKNIISTFYYLMRSFLYSPSNFFQHRISELRNMFIIFIIGQKNAKTIKKYFLNFRRRN